MTAVILALLSERETIADFLLELVLLLHLINRNSIRLFKSFSP